MPGGPNGTDGTGTRCQQVALSAASWSMLSLHLGVLLQEWDWDLGELQLCLPSLEPACNQVVGAEVTPSV